MKVGVQELKIVSCNALLFVLLISCTVKGQPPQSIIKGISFVATRSAMTDAMVQPLIDYNATHVAVHPYGFIRGLENPEVLHNSDRQWYGERVQGTRQSIKKFKQAGLKVMLKPQLWIGRGIYTGTIDLKNDEEWKILENSYEQFILSFAQVAQETNSDLFCIGTELESFVKARPAYWDQLIIKIKAIYKGPLTYAANWDSYPDVTFWKQMDFIGVDAYFPVSNEKTPQISQIKSGWEKWARDLQQISNRYEKKILFTEYGYVSADYAGKEPWQNAGDERAVNEAAQYNLLKAQYELIWNQEWFAGGFLWKHHAEPSRHGFEKRFTPQEKKAAQLVTDVYSNDFSVKN